MANSRSAKKTGKAGAARNRNGPQSLMKIPGKKIKPNATKPAGDKICFTRENINAHLVSCAEDPSKYKLMGLLTYLFKEFKGEPGVLLSKLKVLTMKSKSVVEKAPTEVMIMEHVFLVLKVQGEFNKKLFELLQYNNFFAILLAEVYFGAKVEDEDEWNSRCQAVIAELLKIWEGQADLCFEDFCAEIGKYGESETLESLLEMRCCEDSSCGMHSQDCTTCEEELDTQLVSKHDVEVNVDSPQINTMERPGPVDLEESSFSLVSLSDDNQIARLDEELGKRFRGTAGVPEEKVTYSLLLVDCLKHIINNNYVSSMGIFYYLIYFKQFSQLSVPIRALFKAYIRKTGTDASVFRAFVVSLLVFPSTYELYSVFKAQCGDEFDEEMLVKIGLHHGQGNYLRNKISPRAFYGIYTPSAGEDYDELLLGLILKETDVADLEGLLAKGLSEDLAAAVKGRLDRLNNKPAAEVKKPKKQNKPKDGTSVKLVSESVLEVKDEQVVEEVSVETKEEYTEDSVPAPSKAVDEAAADVPEKKKRTFAEKVGARIVEKRKELKKEYRWKNYKEKKKQERAARRSRSEEPVEKITKKLIREEEEKDRAKKADKNRKKRAGKKSVTKSEE